MAAVQHSSASPEASGKQSTQPGHAQNEHDDDEAGFLTHR